MKTIRPRVSLYAAIGASVVTFGAFLSIAISSRWESLPDIFGILGVIDIAIWVFFIAPKISFDESHVIVVNPFRILRADWGAVTGFETKFGLTFVTSKKKFVAWSAPAPSRREVRRIDRHDLKGTQLEGLEFIEPGLTHNSESGSVYWQLDEVRGKANDTAKSVAVVTNWSGVLWLTAALVLAYLGLHS